jgi:sterol desaturase/sphingolipid hydroxylase (fatty acid hydroxylase superfamily)
VTFYLALGLFLAFLLAGEKLAPEHAYQRDRWPVNTILGAVSLGIAAASRLAGPLAGALWAQQSGFGLLNFVTVPDFVAGLIAIILMDLAVWFQHQGFHRFGPLWRLHRLHHRDPTLDVTTGFRFHPLEAVLSLAYKGACAALIGIPLWAVPLFEAWLLAGNLFEHANIRFPKPLDRILRLLIVTPAMHRVHHSRHGRDAQHNYGFALSIWDRIFGTYRAMPSGPDIGDPGLDLRTPE